MHLKSHVDTDGSGDEEIDYDNNSDADVVETHFVVGKKLGKNERFTPAQDSFIRKMIEIGETIVDIAIQLKRSPESIYYRANRLGISCRGRKMIKKNKEICDPEDTESAGSESQSEVEGTEIDSYFNDSKKIKSSSSASKYKDELKRLSGDSRLNEEMLGRSAASNVVDNSTSPI